MSTGPEEYTLEERTVIGSYMEPAETCDESARLLNIAATLIDILAMRANPEIITALGCLTEDALGRAADEESIYSDLAAAGAEVRRQLARERNVAARLRESAELIAQHGLPR